MVQNPKSKIQHSKRKLTRDEINKVQGESASSLVVSVVTTGGIRSHSKYERENPSKMESGSSVFRDIGGIDGRDSMTYVRKVYSPGTTGEKRKDGEAPNQGTGVNHYFS